MAARLLHLRRLLLQSDRRRPAVRSSAPYPPPYAVLGRPRRLSTETAAAPPDLLRRRRYKDVSDTLFFILAFLYFSRGAGKAYSRVRQVTASNQHLEAEIERMDNEIRALEEKKMTSSSSKPFGDRQLQAGSSTHAQRHKAHAVEE